MDGVLVIDKPAGITSHDVVDRARRILGTRRVGHTGTLDPFATGVMVVLVGQATRLAQFIDKDEKEYEATIGFGYETDTGDNTGTARSEAAQAPARAEIQAVLSRFRGEIQQTPPMYSAKRVDGKKLYESARKGIEIERKPQTVRIEKLEIVEDSRLASPESQLTIRVACSAGTYIRTLAEDIGRAVKVGAHLTQLRRTRSGRFDLSMAVTLEALDALQEPSRAMLPIERAVEHLPEFKLGPERVIATRNGMSTRVLDALFPDGSNVRMLSPDNALVAIGSFSAPDSAIKPKVVLV